MALSALPGWGKAGFGASPKCCSAFPAQALEVGDQGPDILRLELELRHIGVPDDNPLAKRLFQVFDIAFCGDIPEGRSAWMSASSGHADSVAISAELLSKFAPRLYVVGRLRLARDERESGQYNCETEYQSSHMSSPVARPCASSQLGCQKVRCPNPAKIDRRSLLKKTKFVCPAQ